MRKVNYLILSGLLMTSFALEAQFDDLYYDPDTDDSYYYDNDYYDDGDDYDYYYDDESDYYDDYDYMSDYDYYYTSRLRRFNRSYVRLGFYNSWACNSLFYDPWDFYYPYVGYGGSYFSFSIGNPYFNIAYNPWGYYGGYNSWANYYNPWRPYGWGGSYFGSSYNPYCPPYYAGGNGYYGGPGYVGNVQVGNIYNQNTNPKGVYYGSRRAGSTSSSVKGVRDNPRINNRTDEVLNPGALGEDTAVRTSLADAQSPERRTPRRTLNAQDELAVSRLSERPSRRTAMDGASRVEDRSAVSRISRRPSRRSIDPNATVSSDNRISTRPSRRSVDQNTRPSSNSSTRQSTSRTSQRSNYNNNSRSNYSRSNSSRSNFSRSSNSSGSSSRTSSSRSSSPSRSSSSRSSSPRRNG